MPIRRSAPSQSGGSENRRERLGQTGSSFCGLFGTTVLFSADQLFSLYTDQQGYVDAVTTATEAAFDLGFLLREDADQIIEWAPQQWQIQTQD